ncbi:MAG TPA: hypothetical protein VH560_05580 [Polyangia bacterium]|jgi:hypothetical protein|nr:hypothetical protein [Polyangia bacterium]
MPATPKAKQPPAPPPQRSTDRTSAVVTTTLIVLTVLGVLTIFWEPLTALALGTPATDTVAEPRAATATDGGAATSATTRVVPNVSVDASGSS